MVEELGTKTYDNLFAGNVMPVVSEKITVESGAGDLPIGTVLARKANEKCIVVYSEESSPGDHPYCILAEAVDATSADVEAVGLLTGEFNEDTLYLGDLEAVKASYDVGEDTTNYIKIKVSEPGDDGNDYTVTVTDDAATEGDLDVDLTGKDLTIQLGKSGGSTDVDKNKLSYIAAEVDGLTDLEAEVTGDGDTRLTSAMSEKSFEGGQTASDTIADHKVALRKMQIFVKPAIRA